MRGLREHMLDFRVGNQKWTLNMSKSTFYLGVGKMSLRHPKDTQNHFHVLNRKMTHVSQKREFRPFQNHAQVHQIRRPPRKMMSETTSHFAHTYIPQSFMNMQKYRTCQADEKVSHVLRLSRKTKFQIAKCPNAPATKNGHSLTNEYRAPAKVDLRKRARHCVRACAVKMRMAIPQGNFCASRRRRKPAPTANNLI
jgi:hypothetical protein